MSTRDPEKAQFNASVVVGCTVGMGVIVLVATIGGTATLALGIVIASMWLISH